MEFNIPDFNGIRVPRCVYFGVVFCRSLFGIFLLDIALSFLRFTTSDYPFKLFLFLKGTVCSKLVIYVLILFFTNNTCLLRHTIVQTVDYSEFTVYSFVFAYMNFCPFSLKTCCKYFVTCGYRISVGIFKSALSFKASDYHDHTIILNN